MNLDYGTKEVPATQDDVDAGYAAQVGDLMTVEADTGAFLF